MLNTCMLDETYLHHSDLLSINPNIGKHLAPHIHHHLHKQDCKQLHKKGRYGHNRDNSCGSRDFPNQAFLFPNCTSISFSCRLFVFAFYFC